MQLCAQALVERSKNGWEKDGKIIWKNQWPGAPKSPNPALANANFVSWDGFSAGEPGSVQMDAQPDASPARGEGTWRYQRVQRVTQKHLEALEVGAWHSTMGVG